jgi:signal transduction histidine kinase
VRAEEHPQAIRLCDHPRASRQIELARGWGGIGAFVFVALLSSQAGVSMFVAGSRALVAGIVAYFAFWALAVLVWRYLAVAEADAARAAAEERRLALVAEIERRSGTASQQPSGR